MVSEKGLEPSQISPYAPETYVSTISPLRHGYRVKKNDVSKIVCGEAHRYAMRALPVANENDT